MLYVNKLINSLSRLLLLASLMLPLGQLAAEEIKPGKQLQQRLQELGMASASLRKTPVKGLLEMQLGTQVFYVTEDGAYVLTGNMIRLPDKVNLTEKRLSGLRAEAIDAVGSNNLVRFKSAKQAHRVTIFTDIDCGYCRKLHSQMPEYNELGITVDYLFFPRSGPGSESYSKAVSVWCDKDRQEAMTHAKTGAKVDKLNCKNPVASHYQLGSDIGISGTPAIVTEQGDLLPGYIPPGKLQEYLLVLQAEALADQQTKASVK